MCERRAATSASATLHIPVGGAGPAGVGRAKLSEFRDLERENARREKNVPLERPRPLGLDRWRLQRTPLRQDVPRLPQLLHPPATLSQLVASSGRQAARIVTIIASRRPDPFVHCRHTSLVFPRQAFNAAPGSHRRDHLLPQTTQGTGPSFLAGKTSAKPAGLLSFRKQLLDPCSAVSQARLEVGVVERSACSTSVLPASRCSQISAGEI